MSLISRVNIDELDKAISHELTLYSQEITEKIKTEAKIHADLLVKKTKETAPVGIRKKHYRDNIVQKKTNETAQAVTHTWHVKGKDYRLSHLLNNGHALKNGGRVEGTGFITNAEKEVIEAYEKRIEEVIENGK